MSILPTAEEWADSLDGLVVAIRSLFMRPSEKPKRKNEDMDGFVSPFSMNDDSFFDEYVAPCFLAQNVPPGYYVWKLGMQSRLISMANFIPASHNTVSWHPDWTLLGSLNTRIGLVDVYVPANSRYIYANDDYATVLV